jgi:hypothetical protein
MNTPTPTPRTDSAWAKTFDEDEGQCRAGNAASDMRDECATLERELAALTSERDQLQAALALGQENCDAAYDELRGDADELRADVVRLTAERDQLRAEAQRFQRLQRFIDSAAAEMKAGLITFGGIAELRAECDQLRAENIAFRAAQKACEACDEPTAFEVRQFRAEMERLRSDRDCEKRLRKDAEEFRENAIARAERAEAELATEQEKSERYRLATLKLDAELATERARLGAGQILIKMPSERVWVCGVDLRAAIDAAMKEDAK